MNQAEFETELRKDGYEVKIGEIKPHEKREEHAHDYDVRALVLAGAITLTCDGQPRRYASGDVFVMAAGKPHQEQTGADGVQYVAGRRNHTA